MTADFHVPEFVWPWETGYPRPLMVDKTECVYALDAWLRHTDIDVKAVITAIVSQQ